MFNSGGGTDDYPEGDENYYSHGEMDEVRHSQRPSQMPDPTKS